MWLRSVVVTKVLYRFLEESWIVVELTNAIVALHAQQGSNLAGGVVVVDRKVPLTLTLFCLACFWFAANGAKTILGGVHGLVFSKGQTVVPSNQTFSFILALLLYPFRVFLHAFVVFPLLAHSAFLAMFSIAMLEGTIAKKLTERLDYRTRSAAKFCDNRSGELRSLSSLCSLDAITDTVLANRTIPVMTVGYFPMKLSDCLGNEAFLAEFLTIAGIESGIVSHGEIIPDFSVVCNLSRSQS